MRARSLSALQEILDKQLSWRKRELTTLRRAIDKSRSHEKEILTRGAVCLLYAHWEGFVSLAAKAYLSFVVSERLNLKDLAPNFIGLGLKTDIQETGRSDKPVLYTELTKRMRSNLDERFRVDWRSAIQTKSNLNVDVLSDILRLVGIDPTSYLGKRPIINQRLVDSRNIIAHGGRLEVSIDYDRLHEDVLQLMGWVRDDIVNAAVTKTYRRHVVEGWVGQ